MPAVYEGTKAGEKVGGYEERSPPFILTDVHALVRPRDLQRARIPADHDVPERHRVGTTSERSE